MNKKNQHCSEWISKLDRSPVGGPGGFLLFVAHRIGLHMTVSKTELWVKIVEG